MRDSVKIALAMLLSVPTALAADAAPRFDGQRLFTTAAQREQLDALRDGKPLPERPPESRRQTLVLPPEKKTAEKKPPAVTLQGFVRRSGGRSAVWANGQSTLRDRRIDGDVRISGRIEGTAVLVTLPDGRTVRLQPGEVWDPKGERVIDQYRR